MTIEEHIYKKLSDVKVVFCSDIRNNIRGVLRGLGALLRPALHRRLREAARPRDLQGPRLRRRVLRARLDPRGAQGGDEVGIPGAGASRPGPRRCELRRTRAEARARSGRSHAGRQINARSSARGFRGLGKRRARAQVRKPRTLLRWKSAERGERRAFRP